jgi:hypothetical protein
MQCRVLNCYLFLLVLSVLRLSLANIFLLNYQDGSKPGIVGYQPGAPPEGYNPSLLPTLIPFPPPVISVPPPGYHPMGGAQKRPYDGSGYDVPSKRYCTNTYSYIRLPYLFYTLLGLYLGIRTNIYNFCLQNYKIFLNFCRCGFFKVA